MAAPKLDADGAHSPRMIEDWDGISVTQTMAPFDVVQLAFEKKIRHLIQKDGLAFDQELLTAQLMRNQPHRFLRDPLSCIIGSDSSQTNHGLFHCIYSVDEKKHRLLEEFTQFLSGIHGARAIRDEAVLIADELYTNCRKNSISAAYLKSQAFRPGAIEFITHLTADRLIIVCIDSYGTLDSRLVLEKIYGCYMNGVMNSINLGPGGAGIGSYMVYNSSVSFYLAVEPGRRTAVCCVLPLHLRLKHVANLSKNLHVLVIE